MTNRLKEFEQEQIAKLMENKSFPEFSSGDTLVVKIKIGEREAKYEGICIARENKGINSSFKVRKISHGVGTEKGFPLYSPNLLGIEVLKRGKVKRAKLYYLRGRSAKETRIAEATTGYKGKLVAKSKKRPIAG